MTRAVLAIVRDPDLRNKLSWVFRAGGRDVTSRSQAEGWAAQASSPETGALIVGDDLTDADPGLVVRKAAAMRGDLFVARVGGGGEGSYWAKVDGEEHREPTAEALGAWLEERLASAEAAQAAGEQTLRLHRSGEPEARICGSTPEIQRILQMIEVVAPTDSTVLLQGESGTGKDLFARLIREKSRRRNEPWVEVHCGAIPPSLMESELFGHEKGSFTGATARKVGLCLAAECGTLFLDEIGELPLDMQVKLLRVLQSGWLRPIGATHAVKVDLRVIAATNRDLKQEVLAGRFRLDLYYRLNVINIVIPPLRERRDDIPRLVSFIMENVSQKGIAPVAFPPEVMSALSSYSWPGNVRELENIVERLLLLYPDGRVSLEELDRMLVDVRIDAAAAPQRERLLDEPAPPLSESALLHGQDEDLTLRALEDLHIRRVLRKYEGNKTRAARVLGINVKTLYNKMKAAGIRKEEFQVGEPA